MESSFSGINTALSALYAQKRGLDVTGQNIANANTDGYSRQRVNLQATGGSAVGAVYSLDKGFDGSVQVQSVQRMTDSLLASRQRSEHAQDSYLNTVKGTYTQLEQVYNEPSDTGLQNQLGQVWDGFHDVANNPGDLAARSTVLARAKVVTDSLNVAHNNLTTIYSTRREVLDASVDEINTTADSVAQLNQAIVRGQGSGSSVNALQDERDAKVLRLAELTGGTVVEQENGTTDVYLGGSPLISGQLARHVQSVGAGRLQDQAANPVGLQWTDTGNPVAVGGGEIAGDLLTLNSLVPDQSNRLDTVANSLISSVNQMQTAGYDLNGTAGTPMFTGTSAADISVAMTDPAQVAASASAGGNLDGSNADAMAALADAPAGPDVTYRKNIADLGVSVQSASRRADIQDSVTSDVDSTVGSQSGVNLDEEMTNMLQYQRAYEAASKLLTVIDSTLDTLINHTGIG